MDVCPQCGDDFDEHSLITLTGNVMDGGVIICPRPGCECYSTWSPHYRGQESHMPKQVPTNEQLAEIRERLWRKGQREG